MGVKVAVVGGGSTYTPELVEGFVTRTDRLPIDELVLLDVDPDDSRSSAPSRNGWCGPPDGPERSG
jgi:6-phospho-beta-glucosidase